MVQNKMEWNEMEWDGMGQFVMEWNGQKDKLSWHTVTSCLVRNRTEITCLNLLSFLCLATNNLTRVYSLKPIHGRFTSVNIKSVHTSLLFSYSKKIKRKKKRSYFTALIYGSLNSVVLVPVDIFQVTKSLNRRLSTIARLGGRGASDS